MPGCVLHVGGNFDVDSALGATSLEPYQVWRQGDVATTGRRLPHEDSGFSLTLSGPGVLEDQAETVARFLERHKADLGAILALEGVTQRELDFGYSHRSGNASDLLPLRLLSLCVELALPILLSHYAPEPEPQGARLDTAIEALADRLRAAKRVLVLTGAGVSVASGLSTYRGDEHSVYEDEQALKDAFGSTIRKDPAGFWARFEKRRKRFRQAKPNAAHDALVVLGRRFSHFCLATQNVDNLHSRAGSKRVVELHGNGLRERCLDEACPQTPWRAGVSSQGLPTCPTCGQTARPDVVLFGEGDDSRWEPLRRFLAQGVDVVLLIGTSGVVPVPTQVCQLVRQHESVWIGELNPRPTDESELKALVNAQFAFAAEDVLPALARALGGPVHD